MSIETTVQN